jgi:hypothetical protein
MEALQEFIEEIESARRLQFNKSAVHPVMARFANPARLPGLHSDKLSRIPRFRSIPFTSPLFIDMAESVSLSCTQEEGFRVDAAADQGNNSKRASGNPGERPGNIPVFLQLSRRHFEDKILAEDRFDRILEELRRDREAQYRKWDANQQAINEMLTDIRPWTGSMTPRSVRWVPDGAFGTGEKEICRP